MSEDFADDRGNLSLRELVEAEESRRIQGHPVALAGVGKALTEDFGTNTPDNAIGDHAASPLVAKGFSTKEHESESLRTSPRLTKRASRFARFSLNAAWSTSLALTRWAPSTSSITNP